jgi:SAM-dependent methyltransferase
MGFYQGGIHKYLARYIRNLPSLSGKVAIDVPCGAGRGSYEFLRKGAEVKALDLFPEFMELDGLVAQFADLSAPLPLKDNSGDFLLCEEGIEHLPNQLDVLREFGRVLRKGGVLLLTTPNYSHLRSRFSRYLFDSDYWKRIPPTEIDSVWFAKRESDDLYFGHLFLLDVQTLQSLISLAGFRVTKRVRTSLSVTSIVLGVLSFPFLCIGSFLSWALYRRKNKHIEQALRDKILWERVKLNLSPKTLFCKQIFWVMELEKDQGEVIEYLRKLQRYKP